MACSADMVAHRFIKAVRVGEDARKLHTILAAVPKDELEAWTDQNQQDVLHYAVMADHPEAVDFLLKMGYFSAPYEPQVNMYAHLAARLGLRSVLCTVLQHRPEDFRMVGQPLIILPECCGRGGNTRNTFSRTSSKEPEHIMPAVVGNQVYGTESRQSAGSPRGSLVSRHSSLYGSTKHASMILASRLSKVQSGAGLKGSANQELGITPGSQIPSRVLQQQASIQNKTSDQVITSTVRQRQLSYPGRLSKKMPSFLSKRRFSSPEDSGFVTMELSTTIGKPLMYTPLDVAARSKHVDCVKALLDMVFLRAHPDIGTKGYLTLAALADNYYSLKLLMAPYANGTNDPTVREDFRTAVQTCVENIYPECLTILLNAELIDPKQVFKQINYFHVMYSQPFNTQRKIMSLSRLPTMTQNLIAKGHDVKAKSPPRTYPLYSLIDGAFTSLDFSRSEYVVTCMKMMMENGADPNFDEVDYERQLAPSVGSRHYGGRYAFSSALHCAIQSLERNRDSYQAKAPAIRFLEECVDVLIAYGADIEKMGFIDAGTNQTQGDVLWQFARSSVSIGMERGLLHCLTRFGAQPQRNINGQFALNVYMDTLCLRLRGDPAAAQSLLTKRERDLTQMVSLMCSFMAPWHIRTVLEYFNYRHKKCTGDAHEMFKRRVRESLEDQGGMIHSLRTISAWQVWKLCHRKAANVQRLPVSKELKMHVLPLVLFQTLW